MVEEWISWDAASELTGINVPTIEHAVRVGRIERRPRLGSRPSLLRRSVLAWAEQHREVLEGRRQRRRHRGRRQRNPPGQRPHGWLNANEAASQLECSAESVRRWAAAGELTTAISGRLWIEPESLRDLLYRRQAWVSRAEAAKILDCTIGHIETLMRRGDLEPRAAGRRYPSLARADVETYGAHTPVQPMPSGPRHPPSAPPEDGHVWLSTMVVAIMLNTTRSEISRRVRLEKLPGVKVGRRVWVRREDAEVAAAAKALAQPS